MPCLFAGRAENRKKRKGARSKESIYWEETGSAYSLNIMIFKSSLTEYEVVWFKLDGVIKETLSLKFTIYNITF